MPISNPKLIYSNENNILIRLVKEIIIYWKGSIFTQADGILNFYSEVMNIIGKDLKYFETESMGGARKIKTDTFELLPYWLTSDRSKKRGIYMLKMESGTKANEPSDKAFFFLADEEEDIKTGMIRLVLPFNYLDGNESELIELVKRLVSKLDFESGHVGYSVNWDPDGENEEDAANEMLIISKKYPGIDVNYFDSTLIAFQNSIKSSIKCVNWLTIIGADIRKQLPGSEKLKLELSPDASIYELKNGLIFQAGPEPSLGYPDKHQLDSYYRVGHLLSDFRLSDHPQILPDSTRGENATEDWLNRFD